MRHIWGPSHNISSVFQQEPQNDIQQYSDMSPNTDTLHIVEREKNGRAKTLSTDAVCFSAGVLSYHSASQWSHREKYKTKFMSSFDSSMNEASLIALVWLGKQIGHILIFGGRKFENNKKSRQMCAECRIYIVDICGWMGSSEWVSLVIHP